MRLFQIYNFRSNANIISDFQNSFFEGNIWIYILQFKNLYIVICIYLHFFLLKIQNSFSLELFTPYFRSIKYVTL